MVNANNVCTYIEEATIDLLKKKKLKDITIMEVVKKAGVCRASFYRYYADLDDVLHSYLSSLERFFIFDNNSISINIINNIYYKHILKMIY